jgi:hypothetical protein
MAIGATKEEVLSFDLVPDAEAVYGWVSFFFFLFLQ